MSLDKCIYHVITSLIKVKNIFFTRREVLSFFAISSHPWVTIDLSTVIGD